MAPFHDRESAYIGSHACAFATGRPILTPCCRRRARPLSHESGRWRCSMPEDAAGGSAETEDKVEQAEGKVSMDALEQAEGSISMGALDAGLEAALSKDWDKLELFGSRSLRNDNGVEDGEGEKKKRKSMEAVEDGEDGGEASASLKAGAIIDAGPKSKTSKAAAEKEIHDAKTEEKAPKFLETSASKESDAAVAAINEAKKPKKRRQKAPAKKKATTKIVSASRITVGGGADDGEDEEAPEMTQTEILNSEEWDLAPRWFFLQVKPGCEQSCAISLRNMAASLEELEVLEVLVPVTKIMRLTKGGKSVQKEERIFPGYIMVLMVMNRQNYADVQKVPNVQWFMGDPNRDKKKDQPFRPPLPVSDAEMRAVFDKIKEADSAKPEVKTSIRPGNSIKVTSGSFVGNTGRVLEVKPDRQIVKASLLVFGRETSVELEFGQVEVFEDIMNVEDPSMSDEPENTDSTSEAVDDAPSPQKELKGGAASPEDELAALLADDEGDTEGDFWDSLASDSTDSADDGFSEGEVIDSLEEVTVANKRDVGAKNRPEDSKGEDAVEYPEDDLSLLLSNGKESDIWGSDDTPAMKNAPTAETEDVGIDEIQDGQRADYDPETDPFSFLDDGEFEEEIVAADRKVS